MRILAINPGSTSTKISVYDDLKEVLTQNIKHSVEELAPFPKIIDQYEFRKNSILHVLEKEKIELQSIFCVVGRGGLVRPIPGGVYEINDALCADLRAGIMGEHASNLGGLIARSIAESISPNTKSYIVDPVVVDELEPIARYSGHPEIPRTSIFHALNQKAVARRFAREKGKKYEELNLIIAHLGGGISIGAHRQGKVIDVNNALDGEGPFSPERTGTLPAGPLAKLCFSGKYTYEEIKKMITGKGGFVAYLGTNDAYEVEKRCAAGDEKALAVSQAMAYQIAKEIGALSTVFYGKLDAILITGGMAKGKDFVKWIEERVKFIAPIAIYPGEDEMIALVEGVFYALKGEQPIKEYKFY